MSEIAVPEGLSEVRPRQPLAEGCTPLQRSGCSNNYPMRQAQGRRSLKPAIDANELVAVTKISLKRVQGSRSKACPLMVVLWLE